MSLETLRSTVVQCNLSTTILRRLIATSESMKLGHGPPRKEQHTSSQHKLNRHSAHKKHSSKQ
jgi:hypothetical protein